MSREKEELLETLGLLKETLDDIKTYAEQDALSDLDFELSDLYEGLKKMTILYALYLKELSSKEEGADE